MSVTLNNNICAVLSHKHVFLAVKRAGDIAISLIVLTAFWWLFALIAIAVKADDTGGPVIFSQTRISRRNNGCLTEFTLYKFRTMVRGAEEMLPLVMALNEKNGPAFKIHNDPRLTRVGRVLRKTSLDELPQFVNVLKGELSVVGPRPALPSEIIRYTPEQCMRLAIKPGLTCYWQTRRNRDSLTFDEWVALDMLYIQKCSVWTDTKLIIQTIGCMFLAQGN